MNLMIMMIYSLNNLKSKYNFSFIYYSFEKGIFEKNNIKYFLKQNQLFKH